MDKNSEVLNTGTKRRPNGFFSCFFLLIFGIIMLVIVAIVLICNIQGPPGPATQIRGLEVQLQGATLTINDNEPVIFDTIISDQSEGISYDATTGEITITETGTYYINWWFSADGSPIATTIDLSIETSTGVTITASNPILSGQMSGNALLAVTASAGAPVTVQLVNTTGNEIFVGNTTVRADLTIMNVAL